jgi:DHA1 family tetracycline resistance protein-like MFS transporter
VAVPLPAKARSLRRRGSRRRPPLPPGFGIIWTTVALDLVGFGIVLPVLPLYARRYHASAATAGALVAAFSLAQLLASPLWGRVSDRVGRKPVLIVSLVGTALGSLLTGLAGGLPLLFVGRLVDGASGASVSVAQASVADFARPEERARLFGLLGAAFGLGFVLGPALGGLLAPISPRLPFFAAALVAGVNALVAVRRLPETKRASGRSSAPHPRQAVSTDGAAPPPPVPVEPGSSAGPISAPAPSGAGPPRSVARSGAWRQPPVLVLIGVSFLSLVAFSAFEGTFSLFSEERLGLRESSAYLVFFIIGVLIVLVEVGLVHPVVRRVGERGALQAGLVLNAAGLALLPAVHSRWWLAPSLILLTAGEGLITPTLASTVAGQVEPRERGEVLGVQQSAGGLARVIGPSLGGVAFGAFGAGMPYAAGAVIVAVAAGGLALAPRPSPAPGGGAGAASTDGTVRGEER